MSFTKTKFGYIVCLIILLTSCTLTTTKEKAPVFYDMKKLEKELISLVTSENINFAGKEISSKKKTTSELEVSITNGQSIPANDEEMKALGKSIATTVKRNLKDTLQFDTYLVLFVTKVENNGVTKRNWTEKIFNSSEL